MRLESSEVVKDIVRRLRLVSDKRVYATNSYAKDRQKYIARAGEWCAKNPERALAIRRKSRGTEQSRELTSVRRQRRRTMEYGASGEHTIEEWREKKRLFDYQCAYCGRQAERLTKDHIVPLSRGGTNDIENIVPACMWCNISKGVRPVSPLAKQLVLNSPP